VVGKLELVIGVVLHIIFIFFYLMVFNVSLSGCMHTLLDSAFACTVLCAPSLCSQVPAHAAVSKCTILPFDKITPCQSGIDVA